MAGPLAPASRVRSRSKKAALRAAGALASGALASGAMAGAGRPDFDEAALRAPVRSAVAGLVPATVRASVGGSSSAIGCTVAPGHLGRPVGGPLEAGSPSVGNEKKLARGLASSFMGLGTGGMAHKPGSRAIVGERSHASAVCAFIVNLCT